MSTHKERPATSGRAKGTRCVFRCGAIMVSGCLLGASVAHAAQQQTPLTPVVKPVEVFEGSDTTPFALRGLKIGPIAGLTTGWHAAPEQVRIPIGSDVRFLVRVPAGASVSWDGAAEIARYASGPDEICLAECPVAEVRLYDVAVEATIHGVDYATRCRMRGVEVDLSRIVMQPFSLSAEPAAIDPDLPLNPQTVELYFTDDSLAELDLRERGAYVTSLNHKLTPQLLVDPPELADLIEWRVDGAPYRLGADAVIDIGEEHGPGVHVLAAGPPRMERSVPILTYAVTIHSPLPDTQLPQGEPITFVATTDPPGFEDRVTWLASTKFGSAVPVFGYGSSFTVQFDDTWGFSTGGWQQWAGVKAGYAALGLDRSCFVVPEDMVFTGRTSIPTEPLPVATKTLSFAGTDCAGPAAGTLNNVPLSCASQPEAKCLTKTQLLTFTVNGNSCTQSIELDADNCTAMSEAVTLNLTNAAEGEYELRFSCDCCCCQ